MGHVLHLVSFLSFPYEEMTVWDKEEVRRRANKK